MLPLDVVPWSRLKHAYGQASDIPELLRELLNNPTATTWSDLWSTLCHQSSVYPASFAAYPYLALVAARLQPGQRGEALLLLGMIAAGETEGACPTEFRDEFEAAKVEAIDLVLRELEAQPKDVEDTVYLMEAFAGLHGCSISTHLEGFNDGEFYCECPQCGGQLYLWPEEGCYRVFAGDPIKPNRDSLPATQVKPAAESPVTELPVKITDGNALVWVTTLARLAGHPGLAERARQAFGDATCPRCAAPFTYLEAFSADLEAVSPTRAPRHPL